MGRCAVVELKSIGKDRKDNEQAQSTARQEERDSFQKLLDQERADTKGLLDQEGTSLSSILTQQQTQFAETMTTFSAAQKQDQQKFTSIIKREEGVLESQQEMSERFAGRLVPGDAPTPPNSCDLPRLDPKFLFPNLFPKGIANSSITTIIFENDNAILYTSDMAPPLNQVPFNILKINDTPVISFDQRPGSSDIYLSVDFRDQRNRILIQVNQNGIIQGTYNLWVLRPDKSTLLIEDDQGREFFRATYLNPHAFKISGKVVYCGAALDMMEFKRSTHNCAPYVSGDVFEMQMKCPRPQ